MPDKRIRIIPKRRELDLEKLAEALLDLVDSLTPEQLERFATDGERVLKSIADPGSKRKSA
jgi:hypothetical protein